METTEGRYRISDKGREGQNFDGEGHRRGQLKSKTRLITDIRNQLNTSCVLTVWDVGYFLVHKRGGGRCMSKRVNQVKEIGDSFPKGRETTGEDRKKS